METELLVNVEAVNRMLTDLSFKNKRKAVQSALRMAGNMVKREVVRSLKQSVNADAALTKGVKVVVFRNLQGVRVHIMGDYRLKWLELGTEDRWTRWGYKSKRKTKEARYSGKIKPAYFFRDSVPASSVQAQQSLEGFILRAIKKHTK